MPEGDDLIRDERFMRRALRLARKGEGRVSPNPLVGAVIVQGDRIIGEGFHHCCGGNHAEINALAVAREPVAGATVYVTLEPCSHFGRTPPCANALVAHSPARVVIGTVDPNPLVAGKGIAILKAAGIEVTTGVLAEECLQLNEIFFKYIQTGHPFVTLKLAQTLDGRIATATGDSRWVSSPTSLTFAHRLRRRHDAILVGAGTVLADDPALTCRLVRGKNPLRIVVDSRLRTPSQARLFAPAPDASTILATVHGVAGRRRLPFEMQGVEIWEIGKDADGHVDLKELLKRLGKRGITSVLVEGGAGVATSLLKERLVDRLVVVLAPKLVGKGINAIGDLGITKMTDALPFCFQQVRRQGGDLILDARPLQAIPPAAPPP